MAVSADGVGMAVSAGDAKPGLGTSIVTALAKQLRADITIAAANPGTTVSVVHAEDADPDGDQTARQAEPAA